MGWLPEQGSGRGENAARKPGVPGKPSGSGSGSGLLRQWAALESRAAAGKRGVLRALMREEDLPPAGGHHGDLPDGWSKSLTREIALALALSAPGTEKMMWFAWDLQARLPGIGGLLADGTLTMARRRSSFVPMIYITAFRSA